MVSCKILKRIYLVIIALIIVVCSYLYVIKVVPVLAYFLILDWLVWCVSVCYLFLVNKRESSIICLMNECRMKDFIEKYSHEHSRDTKKGFHPEVANILAIAYMHLGELDTSVEMFRSAEMNLLQNARNKAYVNATIDCAVCNNNLACVYLRCHETERAKLHMEKARDYLKQLHNTKKLKEQHKKDIAILNQNLEIRELELELELDTDPDYEEEIKKIKNWIDAAENTLKKVYYNYLLYVIYRKNGNEDEAEMYSDYVKKNGGDTCYVQWVEDWGELFE